MVARLAVAFVALLSIAAAKPVSPDWLEWSQNDADGVVRTMAARGRIGGGRRLLNTERARSYKLVATWLTPQVLRASARRIQLRDRVSDDQATALLGDLEAAGHTIVMIELDPDEGSGVIPLDWSAFLQPRSAPDRAVMGVKMPTARDVKVLAGVSERNYDYDRFWVEFPTRRQTGEPVFTPADREAELIVRIYDREGRVTWRIPSDVTVQ
jgi:hypothetical protein